MSNINIKRIKEDILVIKRMRLDKINIFVDIDDDNLMNMRIMMIGPKNTPYENGFYFFDLKFTNKYPFEPPKMTFINPNTDVRFHPNFYKKGKICLSILNTWHGPGWTASQNTSNILTHIMAVMTKHPIQNEPGWENECGDKSIRYNNIIAYHNISSSIIKNLKRPPPTFEIYKDLMIQKFIENYESILNFINKYKYLDGEFVKSSIYMMAISNYNIETLNNSIINLKNKYEIIKEK